MMVLVKVKRSNSKIIKSLVKMRVEDFLEKSKKLRKMTIKTRTLKKKIGIVITIKMSLQDLKIQIPDFKSDQLVLEMNKKP